MIITDPKNGYFYLCITEKNLPERTFLGFLEELKEIVPSEDRSYDGETKQWKISHKFHQSVSLIADQHHFTVTTE